MVPLRRPAALAPESQPVPVLPPPAAPAPAPPAAARETRPLGKGMFARVRVESTEQGPVAIKTYDHAEAREHRAIAEHMKNEERLAAKALEHENIIAPQASRVERS